jgi:hypothetical protein
VIHAEHDWKISSCIWGCHFFCLSVWSGQDIWNARKTFCLAFCCAKKSFSGYKDDFKDDGVVALLPMLVGNAKAGGRGFDHIPTCAT